MNDKELHITKNIVQAAVSFSQKKIVNLKIKKPKKLLNKVRHAPYSNR